MDLTEHTVESKTIFEGVIVKLKVDQARLPNGSGKKVRVIVFTENAQVALDAGAEDVIPDEDGVYEIYTAPNDLDAVAKAIEADKSVKVLSAEQDMIPSNTVKLDEATEAKVKRLLDMLEESDDVQDVYHNAELTEEPEED